MFLKSMIMKTTMIIALVTTMILSGCTDNEEASSKPADQADDTSPSGKYYQWGDQNFENFVKKVADGKTLKIGFTPPYATEYYEIMTGGAIR